MTTQRLKKAIEVKKALMSLGLNEEVYTGLKEFSIILNEWVKDGVAKKGYIELPELKKYIVYRLLAPEKTMVKISLQKF